MPFGSIFVYILPVFSIAYGIINVRIDAMVITAFNKW